MMALAKQFIFFILLSLFSFQVYAIAITEPTAYITWQGTCLDCLDGPLGDAGSGDDTGNRSIATAILGVASLGNAGDGWTDLSGGNLLTFTYTSAYLGTLTSFHVNPDSTFGLISDESNWSPSQDDGIVNVLFRVDDEFGDVYRFVSSWQSLEEGDNFWGIGILEPDDIGFNGAFNVPEPTTMAIFGLGLAGLGWSRRKRA